MSRTARTAASAVAISFALLLAACTTPNASGRAALATKADLEAIDAALKADRLKSDFDEDSYRRPREALEFLGARPGMKVIDVVSGRGYYSELLSRIAGPTGLVIAQNRPDVSRMAAVLDQRYGNNRLPNVRRMEVDRNALALDPASLDGAILIMVYHDMYLTPSNGPPADPTPFVAKLFAALKPGGVAVVQDHIADPGMTPQEAATRLHRIDPEIVKRDFIGAGFSFDGASDAVRNPADDHRLGVRDAVAHQTDRAMLRFRKP